MNGHTAGPHLTLSGSGLTLEALVRAARDPVVRVQCAPEALKRVALHREQIERISKRYADRWGAVKDRPDAKRELPMVYGVTTGLGEFKGIPIPPDQLKLLQKNILLSHSTGVGEDPNELNLANYFSADVVRGALLMRLNTFLKGHSGVRLETLTYLQAMLNGGIIPLVPLRGSVGSSGTSFMRTACIKDNRLSATAEARAWDNPWRSISRVSSASRSPRWRACAGLRQPAWTASANAGS